MVPDALDFFQQVMLSVRVADIVDIALIALLLFPLLGWLRSGTSPLAIRRSFVLALAFSAVYLLARTFEMYMVERLLESLLIVALVAVVVVFQQELRRFLNRFGSWRPFRATAPDTPTPVDIVELVEAVSQLARDKTGALIALRGREPWDDHIDGGVELDGKLSQPLLYSLFDSGTPGHDGAVLVEESRVTAFAVHLPLAQHLPDASRYGGTRHAAAVGLTERCDALVIVVSEERGTFSVAEGGTLEEVAWPEDLEARLTRFWQRDARPRRRLGPPRWLTTGLLSLSASAFLWLMFAYSPGTIFRSFDVPVQIRNVPADWALGAVEPRTTRITLRGAERAFDLLADEALVVSFEFESLSSGENDLMVHARSLALPASLELYDAEPDEVTVAVRRLVPTEVAVEVPTIGSLPDGLDLVSLTAEPVQVTVLGQEGEAPLRRILTEPVDLRSVEASGSVSRRLSVPTGWRLPPDASAEASVVFEVRAREDSPE